MLKQTVLGPLTSPLPNVFVVHLSSLMYWAKYYIYQGYLAASSHLQGPSIPEFVQGSSRDYNYDVEGLMQQLQQSASFEGHNTT